MKTTQHSDIPAIFRQYQSRPTARRSCILNLPTSMTLDGVGNTVALVDPASNETDWTFNALNLPVTETNALGTTTTTYDLSSDVTSITDGDGRVRDFAYNNLHELTAENWMSGSTVVASMNYAYDAGQQLVSAGDPNSGYAFTYDGEGKTLSVDNAGTPGVPHVVLTGTYDAGGDMTSQSATIAGAKDFLNTYSYDADQRLTMVQQQGQSGGNNVSPKEIDYAYNALSQFTSVKTFNIFSGPRLDVSTGAYSYDAGNRLTGLTYTSNAGANQIDSFGWSYNAGNLVTTFTSADGTASYGYDPTDQLTSANYSTASGGHQPANEAYSFDKNGNRTMTGYSTGSDNLITSDGTFNYTHDADGNTISRTRISSATASDYLTTYSWDYRNRLTDVEYYNNSNVLTKHVHYIYDVFNGLVGEEDDNTGNGSYDHVERYVVNAFPNSPVAGQPTAGAAPPLLQFDGTGNLKERNLVALSPAAVDAVIAQEPVSSSTSGGPVFWMIDDDLGSPDEVLDDSGNVVDKIKRDSFGNVAYESAPTTVHWAGYTGGHLSAATSLIINGARWYDAITGRWLSQDPSGFGGLDTNLSRYVGNDVTNATDPTGLSATGVFGMTYSTLTKGGTLYSQFVTFGDAGSKSGLNCVQMPMGQWPIPDTHFGNQLTFSTDDGSTVAPGTSFAFSYLTGRIELLDPDFAENVNVATADATMMANKAVTFYATAPLMVIMPTYNTANAQIAKLEAQATALAKQINQQTSTTMRVNMTQRLEQIGKRIAELYEWILLIQPRPLTGSRG